ncbi:MAG: DUF429 domain-containing protein [Firmicutes bacterium]|nr:DUF429 domain-containing protein [Alicyclobacillaceae bacterium]MCL6496912.1 DUF429 domain-containing protein [Bacillota bacterium]
MPLTGCLDPGGLPEGVVVGIDVSQSRGLDVAVLDHRLQLAAPLRRRVERACAVRWVAALSPLAVAVDGPASWARGPGGRTGERALLGRGIRLFLTPPAAGARSAFTRWMEEAVALFQALAAVGYRPFQGRTVRGSSLEVFPHATATVLLGRVAAKAERPAVLRAQGVAVPRGASRDGIDALLCALTGWWAVAGRFTALGDALEGWIVVPGDLKPHYPPRRRPEIPAQSEP